MRAVREHPELELQIIVGASALLDKYGDVEFEIENEGFHIDEKAHFIIEGHTPLTMAKSTGLGVIEISSALSRLKPDIVVTIADRYETLATAIAATYQNIVLAHTQGGELTSSIDEKVRHGISKLAEIHLTTNTNTWHNLIQMGENPDNVHVTGCPAMDLVADLDMKLSNEFYDRYHGVGHVIDLRQNYLVVLQHPVTTEYGQGAEQISATLKAITELAMPTVWLWPNIDAGTDDISKRIRQFRERNSVDFIYFLKHMTAEDFARLIYHSKCLVGNSSSGIREGSFLGVPVVNIGTRQRDRERGKNVIDVGCDANEITAAIKKQLSVPNGRYKPEYIYGDGKAGKRIAEILATCPLSIEKRFHSYREGGN